MAFKLNKLVDKKLLRCLLKDFSPARKQDVEERQNGNGEADRVRTQTSCRAANSVISGENQHAHTDTTAMTPSHTHGHARTHIQQQNRAVAQKRLQYPQSPGANKAHLVLHILIVNFIQCDLFFGFLFQCFLQRRESNIISNQRSSALQQAATDRK